jgi:hypothetical protein
MTTTSDIEDGTFCLLARNTNANYSNHHHQIAYSLTIRPMKLPQHPDDLPRGIGCSDVEVRQVIFHPVLVGHLAVDSQRARSSVAQTRRMKILR